MDKLLWHVVQMATAVWVHLELQTLFCHICLDIPYIKPAVFLGPRTSYLEPRWRYFINRSQAITGPLQIAAAPAPQRASRLEARQAAMWSPVRPLHFCRLQ